MDCSHKETPCCFHAQDILTLSYVGNVEWSQPSPAFRERHTHHHHHHLRAGHHLRFELVMGALQECSGMTSRQSHAFLRVGLPMIILVTAGSVILSQLLQGKYDIKVWPAVHRNSTCLPGQPGGI